MGGFPGPPLSPARPPLPWVTATPTVTNFWVTLKNKIQAGTVLALSALTRSSRAFKLYFSGPYLIFMKPLLIQDQRWLLLSRSSLFSRNLGFLQCF